MNTPVEPGPIVGPAFPVIPSWAAPGRAQDVEEAAFRSGTALAVLDAVLRRDDVPLALFRDRLALRAAEACHAITGRPERTGELRNAVHLLRPGELPGPAGALFVQWRRVVTRPVSGDALARVLPEAMVEHVPGWLDGSRTGPVAQAAQALEAVLAHFPREETSGLILADALLARALGWKLPVPLLAAGLSRRALGGSGEDLRLACHHALVSSAREAVRTAADLARRAEQLRAVAPKLRSKRAGEAVRLFLERDALSPTLALTPLMSDRAARRLCDRLVELGAAREMTGRPSFRLYGL